jgi:serine/threonine-protein kinase
MSFENPSVVPGRGVAAGSDDVCDVEVARVLESYLAALEAGQPADPRLLLEEYPHLADRLRACLRVLKVAEQAAQEVTAARGVLQGRHAAALPQGSGTGLSALSTFDFGQGEPPHVLLRELPDELEPLLKPRSVTIPHHGASAGRFQLHGEIARGGMGAVLKCRDVDLGRDLAVKVLLESHQRSPEVVRRFVEEAQIGGQLQHPGVVPVYELGTFPDRRPYFAMKLVKGRTLASLLQERGEPAHDFPRFLAIFEQVCQTMAYAHARGVIHRDLKPSNVMVGSFGEVQVMDWGLAKVLPQGGIADESGMEPAQETVIMTVRSGTAGSGSESQAGSVLGTPAYMAPEQARGELKRIDERCDVFGLGAVFCEILTGRPPFVGSSREEIRARAARGDLTEAWRQLDACGAETELIALAKDCLAAEQDRRPRHAREVAGRMTAYLAGAQERLRAAELARVEAETRAEEAQARAVIERSRRRRTVALAASVLGFVLLAAVGWASLARQRSERRAATERGVTAALAEAGVWREQARKTAVTGNLDHWATAIAAARHAQDLVAQGEAGTALRDRVNAELITLERERGEAQAERRLLDDLEVIRGNRSEHWDPKQSDLEYATSFRRFGMDLDQLDPREAGRRVAQRTAPAELASYLDYWAIERCQARGKRDEASWRRLLTAAQTADPDPWRVALRDLIGRGDRAGLRRLASDQGALESQPGRSLLLLALALDLEGDREPFERVLQRAWRQSPGDFWVNFGMAMASWRKNDFDKPTEAARFLSAAVAIRPRSVAAHGNLGIALRNQGRSDEGIAEYREALRLKPDDPWTHYHLGNALRDQGKLDEAIAEYRKVLRLKVNDFGASINLGNALRDQGKLDEAMAQAQEALRLKPDDPAAHYNAGAALFEQGMPTEAIAEFREAIRFKPDAAWPHNGLGLALSAQGKLDEAIAEFRHALGLDPDSLDGHNLLGNALARQVKLDEAVAEYREAVRLKPNFPFFRYNLGKALRAQGKLEEAITEYRESLRLKPDYSMAHIDLGIILGNQGKLDQAMAEFRVALSLQPDNFHAHANLGFALRERGEFTEAIAQLRKARDLKAQADAGSAKKFTREVVATERQALVANRLPVVLAGKLKPGSAAEMLSFAELCYNGKLYGASARFWTDVFQAQSNLADDMEAEHRYKAACAAARAASGQGKDDPPLDEPAKAHWRQQAIDWLKADLAAWSKVLDSGLQEGRQAVAATLQQWKVDLDLAGLREPAVVAKLREDEQKACRTLWAEVDALLAKGRGGTKQ